MFLEEMNFIKTENFCVLIAGNVTERGQVSLQLNDKKTSTSIRGWADYLNRYISRDAL